MNNDPTYLVQRWNEIREWRNHLLKESDWTQVVDSPFDETTKSMWKQYRQLLRDITITFQHPDEVIFPEQPSS